MIVVHELLSSVQLPWHLQVGAFELFCAGNTTAPSSEWAYLLGCLQIRKYSGLESVNTSEGLGFYYLIFGFGQLTKPSSASGSDEEALWCDDQGGYDITFMAKMGLHLCGHGSFMSCGTTFISHPFIL